MEKTGTIVAEMPTTNSTKGKPMKFIAKLHHNKRNVDRLDEKVLLTGIHNEDTDEQFRDHCWVPVSKKIERLIPKSNRHSAIITFEAEIENYPYDASKQKLTKIKHIQVAG